MSHQEEIEAAFHELEKAINNYVRAIRPAEVRPNIFVHEYVLAVSIESMEAGKGNYTYFSFVAPNGSPKYSIRGLLDEAKLWYQSSTRVQDD